MHLLYFESKNGKLRYYVNYVEYDSNGKIKFVYFTFRVSNGFDNKSYAIDNKDKVNEISTYILTGLLNRTHFRQFENNGYNFVVKKV